MNAQPGPRDWKAITLLAIAAASLIVVLLLPPIHQDPEYHHFADTRAFFGIPNALNVLSNLFFLIVCVLGLNRCIRYRNVNNRLAWLIAFAGIGLVSVGSAWYHWSPDNQTLIWDRLPMTIAFMAFISALLGEYLGSAVTRIVLIPAVATGVTSVIYWIVADDLRLYAWVVFGPLAIIVALLVLYKSALRLPLIFMLAFYIAAKLAESFDVRIFSMAGGIVSGHTLKHVFAAAACYCMVVIIRNEVSAAARHD